MRLLITGGCGFLGSNLAVDAMARGDEVVVFDNLYREGSHENLYWLKSQGKFTFVHGDIRNNNDVVSVVKTYRPDAIFHLAGQVAMTISIADPRMDFEINALGTYNLLEAVRHYANSATLVYSSTNKVYGDLQRYSYDETDTRYQCVEYPNGFSEHTPLDFHSPYGCSKGAADQYMLDYARMFGLKTIVFRHSSMYGGRQFATYDQGWIGWFCQRALDVCRGVSKDPIIISGTGKQVRDVLHVDDMKSLYKAALDNADIARGHVFNIGGGFSNSLSLLELFAMLEDKLKINIDYVHAPVRESDQVVFIADIEKVISTLDWRPTISAENGIDKMISWINSK